MKRRVRLTEQAINNIIRESVRRILTEETFKERELTPKDKQDIIEALRFGDEEYFKDIYKYVCDSRDYGFTNKVLRYIYDLAADRYRYDITENEYNWAMPLLVNVSKRNAFTGFVKIPKR